MINAQPDYKKQAQKQIRSENRNRQARFYMCETGSGYYMMWTNANELDRKEFETLPNPTGLRFDFAPLQGCYNYKRTQLAWHKFMFAKRRNIVDIVANRLAASATIL